MPPALRSQRSRLAWNFGDSRVSKPGLRVYSSIKDLKPVKNGLGISILSTPKGVMSDTAARDANVGGEVLCRVY